LKRIIKYKTEGLKNNNYTRKIYTTLIRRELKPNRKEKGKVGEKMISCKANLVVTNSLIVLFNWESIFPSLKKSFVRYTGYQL